MSGTDFTPAGIGGKICVRCGQVVRDKYYANEKTKEFLCDECMKDTIQFQGWVLEKILTKMESLE
jgi:hypothetical protein